MISSTDVILLVGHGGVPTDLPGQRIMELKRLEAEQRRHPTEAVSAALQALEHEIRHWPRTPLTDPYQTGLEAMAERLRERISDRTIVLAYNEFCTPSVPEAIDAIVANGAPSITVLPTMFTPGGSHSELEIPALLAEARLRHPHVPVRYAWPFDLDSLAEFLAKHLVTPR